MGTRRERALNNAAKYAFFYYSAAMRGEISKKLTKRNVRMWLENKLGTKEALTDKFGTLVYDIYDILEETATRKEAAK